MHARDPVRMPPNTIYCSQSDKKKKNPFPLSQKKLTQCSQRLSGCTAVLWPVNENQRSPSTSCGWWGSITHVLLYEIWKRTGDLSESFLTCLIRETHRRNSEPFLQAGKAIFPFSLHDMNSWKEYFCFKELTCGQAQWHQSMSSPLKQYRVAGPL